MNTLADHTSSCEFIPCMILPWFGGGRYFIKTPQNVIGMLEVEQINPQLSKILATIRQRSYLAVHRLPLIASHLLGAVSKKVRPVLSLESSFAHSWYVCTSQWSAWMAAL